MYAISKSKEISEEIHELRTYPFVSKYENVGSYTSFVKNQFQRANKIQASSFTDARVLPIVKVVFFAFWLKLEFLAQQQTNRQN